jgi:hypothetical protein
MLQMQKISREVLALSASDPSETTRRAPFSKEEIQAYLLGALHDASLNKKKRFRFTQKGTKWLSFLQTLFQRLGYKSWIYREGKRDVYTLETLASFLDFKFDPINFGTLEEQSFYIKGFFDAEGGIPHSSADLFYIQLVQKDQIKIQKIVRMLQEFGIETGKIHNPSKKVDPNYWRVYVRAKSHKDFIKKIGSWHPFKSEIFRKRMVI